MRSKYEGDLARDVQALDVEALTEIKRDSGVGSGSGAWASDFSDSKQSDDCSKDVAVVAQGLTLRAPRRGWWSPGGKAAQPLTGVTGTFAPGTLTLVTGPSGSGKRTLLDVLAGRKTSGQQEGTVTFAGAAPTRAFLRRHTAYVEGEDVLVPGLTVEETIAYAAELRRSVGEAAAARHAAVEGVVKKLGLGGCRAMHVGDSLQAGISRGEARRLSLAVQLIARPSVLFLDEPTRGLDVYSANQVMGALKAAAVEGTTVIAAISRPTELAFSVADSLCVLLKGRVVYWNASGPAALDFAANALGVPPPSKCNSGIPRGGEWLCEVYGAAAADPQQAASLAAAWESRTRQAHSQPSSSEVNQPPAKRSCCLATALAAWDDTATPWWWGLATLIRYRTMKRITNLEWLFSRVVDKLLIAVVLAALYYGMAADVTMFTSLQVSSLLFMWSVMPLWMSVAHLPAIISERRLFVRERDDGLYRTPVYLAARMLEDIVVSTPAILAASALVFSLCKMPGALGLFFLATWSAFCCGIAMAYCVAAWAPSIHSACCAYPMLVGTQLFFAGFLVPFATMTPWLTWAAWLNPLRYIWAAIMSNQFSAARTRFVNGQPVMNYFQFAGEDPHTNIGIAWAFTVAFAVLAAAGMSVRRHYYRR